MSDDFKRVESMESLLEEVGDMENIRENEIVEGTVVQVNQDEAFVDIGYKQEIPVPKRELAYPEPKSAGDVVKVGDKINVYIQSLGGENGGALSKVKADNMSAWQDLESLKDNGEVLDAKINAVVKGGLAAVVNGLRGFIPASQVELNFVKDLEVYVGQTVKVIPIDIDVKRHKLVLSRRKLLQEDRVKKQDEIFSTIEPGQTVKGIVKRLVDYGAFIDIGGIDGLCHISDLSWERVKHPSDVLKVNDEVDVFIKNVDADSKRISLSIKDTLPDPWIAKSEKYKENSIIEGKIIKLTSFGAFMEIEPGFDGLIPMGELSDHRIEKADEAVKNGEVVKVKIMKIDPKRKRISLSINRAKKDAESEMVKKYNEEQAKVANQQ